MIIEDLRAPFPYFGGKRRAAGLIWSALGQVRNYVEPFFGSGAVLLARPRECWATPEAPGTETVNDASRFLANFWRALAVDPEAVTRWADWPVNECDLHARHRWLVDALPTLSAAMQADPDHYDAKIAGWWVWGQCSWIGTGWCDELPAQLPHLGNAGQGVHRQLPHLGNAGQGVHRKLPHLGNAGQGVHRKLPHLGNAGQGVHRKLPHLGNAGQGDLLAYLSSLSDRLRRVRVACGDWSRVCGDSVTWRHGLTGVLLDPPYAEGAQQYAAGGTGSTLSADVRVRGRSRRASAPTCAWSSVGLRVSTTSPRDGAACQWKARGGYGSQRVNRDNENRHRERLWLSPACLSIEPPEPEPPPPEVVTPTRRQLALFGGAP